MDCKSLHTGCKKFAHWLQKVCTQFKIYQQFVSIKIKVLVGLRAVTKILWNTILPLG